MKHIIFSEQDTYPIAILIKEKGFNKASLIEHYIKPLEDLGLNREDMICFTLEYAETGKCPVSIQKAYLARLMPALTNLGVENILCCDSPYFKTLAKLTKADAHYGYVMPCQWQDCESMTVALCPNYHGLFFNPELQLKIDLSLNAFSTNQVGNYVELGLDILHSESYPMDAISIKLALQELHQYPMLTVDIETFSLKFWETGIATIAFAWDEHNGIAFPIDTPEASQVEPEPNYIKRVILRHFFETYQGTLVYQHANFDLKILVNTLYMEDLLDEVGKQEGIEVMTRAIHDTKLVTYLATNSCAGNKLGLKEQAHEFAGNYAQGNINDITKIPLGDLLTYNLVDACATFYVLHKHWDTMVADQQESVYKNIMIPSIKVILQMELTGMPICMEKVAEARVILETEIAKHSTILQGLPFINQLELELTQHKWEKDFSDRKNKAKNPSKIKKKDWDDFKEKDWVTFNPNSYPQVQHLLYEMLGMPVIDLTDTKQPAVGGDTLKKLQYHTKDHSILALLDSLVSYADASKVLSTFITAFEQAVLKSDGWYYLHGSFNLGGTVSGRLSSSEPNLQNIPSGSKWAKIVKMCFVAPPGWIFAGADYASLEDRISALTTKDPAKLKVYTDQYDGHCLRAYSYFKDQMPDIVDTVESINSIKKKYPELRNKSKNPTFLLTYGGTYHGLMNNVGLPLDEAKAIEANYHALYSHSDDWVADKLQQASHDGYVTVAFGLRVRTPLLKQVLWNSRKTPYEAQSEGRTAGNALGQSYGLLNNRAGIEFQKRTLKSIYSQVVKPCAHIHDAQYFLIRDNIDVVNWVNINLVECMEWQELPEIQHPTVKLGGELDLFYPSWETAYNLPNKATYDEIRAAIK